MSSTPSSASPVSAPTPPYAGSIEEAARYVAARMESAGLENAALLPTEGHPLVYADWLHAGDAPTVLVYGHYDVQPADPLADWTSPPFEPEMRDDRLYGRGVSDDKGPMFIPVCVAEAFLQTTERLPVNLKFVIEGEEEMGSAHLAAGVQRYRDRLQADLVLSADGAQWRPDLVTVNVASRGIVSLNLLPDDGRQGSPFRPLRRHRRQRRARARPPRGELPRRDWSRRRCRLLRRRSPPDPVGARGDDRRFPSTRRRTSPPSARRRRSGSPATPRSSASGSAPRST